MGVFGFRCWACWIVHRVCRMNAARKGQARGVSRPKFLENLRCCRPLRLLLALLLIPPRALTEGAGGGWMG